jgi:hypothetical protein
MPVVDSLPKPLPRRASERSRSRSLCHEKTVKGEYELEWSDDYFRHSTLFRIPTFPSRLVQTLVQFLMKSFTELIGSIRDNEKAVWDGGNGTVIMKRSHQPRQYGSFGNRRPL